MQKVAKEKLGMFTGSEAWKLFVGGKGATRDGYIFQKAEEIVTGVRPSFSSKHTEHGLNNEFEALKKFEELTGKNVELLNQKFFVINKNCGATPDGAEVDFNGVILASIDAKCPTGTFFKQKMMLINESLPEYQNSPKSMFFQGQMQMMALTLHNKILGHPPVNKHILVRYLTAMDLDDLGNTIEYDLPLESRMFCKEIVADEEIQNQILTLIEQASNERDLLVEIFRKPII
jgi:hypothetical protein